jgi:O-antigen ligase
VQIGLQEAGTTWQPLAFRPRTHTIWVAFLFSTLLYGWACASIFTHIRRFKIVAKHIVYCAITLSVLAWIQKSTNAQTIYWISNTPTFSKEYFFGSFVNPNHAGAFLAATLPLALAMRGNKKYLYTLILGLGLWSTQSRGAVIAGVLGSAVYAMYMYQSKTRYITLGILISALAAAIQLDFFQDATDPFSLSRIDDWSSERLDIWNDGISAIIQTPLFGTGSGGFVDLYDQIKTNPRFTQTHHSHQELIELLTTYGWLCGSIFIILWIYIIFRGINAIKQLNDIRKIRWRVAVLSGFIAYTASSMIDFPLQIGANLILFVCYSSILLSFSSTRSQTPSPILWVGSSIILILSLITLLPTSTYQKTSTLLRKGESFRVKKQYTQSERFFLSAIRSAPFSSRPLRQYALTVRHRDTQKSINLAIQSTKLAPSNVLTWISLAELYTLEKNDEKAILAWKKALLLDFPNNDDALPFIRKALSIPISLEQKIRVLSSTRDDRTRQMAQVLYENNNFHEAEKLLAPLLEEDTQTQILQAELYLKTKRPHKAWELLSQHPPKNCRLARNIAKALLQSGKSKESIQYYRIAIDHCGATEGLSRQLLIARLLQGEERATMEASLLLRNKDKNIRIRRLLLHALATQKDYKAMIPHLKKLQEQQVLTETEFDDIKRIQYGLPIFSYPLETQ